MTAKYTDASLGWPVGLSLNMLSTGPSSPLAAVRARLRADVSDNLSLLGAVFDGDAAGPDPQDPQLRNRYGVNFRVNDPPLAIGEMQLLWNVKRGDPGLDGKLKFGAWRHFGDFSDQRLNASGVTLADPAQEVRPRCYTVISVSTRSSSRSFCRVAGDDDRGIGIFARASFSSPDRNLIDFYADEFIGLSDQRPKDKFGVAAAYAHVSPWARALDMDFQSLSGSGWPIRRFEGLFTAVYQYEIRAGWTLQPNFQHIVKAGGGAANPLGNNPGQTLRNAEVFGLRTVLKF